MGRPLQRRARKSGKHSKTRHLKIMPRWWAFGGALGLSALGSLALANGRYSALLRVWGLAGASTGAAGLLMGSLEARRPVLQQVCVPIAGLPAALAGLRIAQFGDFHYGPGYTRIVVRQMRRWVEQLQPELILLSGDFIDRSKYLQPLMDELRGLRAPLGVYAVLGNHDYWFDPARLDEALADSGITLLVNEHRVLERNGARLVLAGVDDPWYGDADIDEALADAPPDLPVVLLSHCPDFIFSAAQRKVALQLSGHAHAGHVCLPLLGPAVLPWLGRIYYRGLHCVRGTWLYVNRGVGGKPLRLGAAPELTLLQLAAAPAADVSRPA